MRLARAIVLLTALCSALGAAGCGARVAPWRKETLARRELAFPVLAPQHRSELHVHEIREGAGGATNQVGGGCGCN